jgi:hypothetical protein
LYVSHPTEYPWKEISQGEEEIFLFPLGKQKQDWSTPIIKKNQKEQPILQALGCDWAIQTPQNTTSKMLGFKKMMSVFPTIENPYYMPVLAAGWKEIMKWKKKHEMGRKKKDFCPVVFSQVDGGLYAQCSREPNHHPSDGEPNYVPIDEIPIIHVVERCRTTVKAFAINMCLIPKHMPAPQELCADASYENRTSVLLRWGREKIFLIGLPLIEE